MFNLFCQLSCHRAKCVTFFVPFQHYSHLQRQHNVLYDNLTCKSRFIKGWFRNKDAPWALWIPFTNDAHRPDTLVRESYGTYRLTGLVALALCINTSYSLHCTWWLKQFNAVQWNSVQFNSFILHQRGERETRNTYIHCCIQALSDWL